MILIIIRNDNFMQVSIYSFSVEVQFRFLFYVLFMLQVFINILRFFFRSP